MSETTLTKEIEKTQTFWETTDFYFTAFLVTMGHKMISAKSLGKKMIFGFPSDPNIDALARSFYNNEIQVPVLSYVNALRTVKSYLRLRNSQKGNPRRENHERNENA